MTVREDRILRPDGSLGLYGVVDRADFALVVPVEGDGFHLVEEYRYPIGRRSWSFPQGGFPPGRDGSPEELARLELAEETGYRAGSMTLLGYVNGAHGMTGQGFHAFLATELVPGETAREETEQDMRQAFVSRAEFERMILRGDIADNSTLATYTLLNLYERGSL